MQQNKEKVDVFAQWCMHGDIQLQKYWELSKSVSCTAIQFLMVTSPKKETQSWLGKGTDPD